MNPFDPDAYGPAFAPLLRADRLPELGPGRPVESARPVLAALSEASFPAPVRDRDAAKCCLAGLWLLYDFLDESHAISQEVHTPDGSFWHALMHRREPDASNSKYWWRRVGDHPVISAVEAAAQAEGLEYGGPFAFVDSCERLRGSGSSEEASARRVQLAEWRLLFGHCYSRATV